MKDQPVYADEMLDFPPGLLGAREVRPVEERSLYPDAALMSVEPAPSGRRRVKVRRSQVGRVFSLIGGIFAGVGVFLATIGLILGLNLDPFEGTLVFSILGVIGAVFGTIGITFVLITAIQRRRNQRLLDRGVRIDAEIVGLASDLMVNYNGQHPWRIRCLGYLPQSEQRRTFLSDGFMEVPTWALQETGTTTLPVYLDPTNPMRYYVDDSALRDFMSVK
ncbi:MAG: phage holin family protein [Propionibacteriaceae bacterium]|jgi:hypothetical protein|nr:phage holin family protein [Propionibacteriaceae bacterium]